MNITLRNMTSIYILKDNKILLLYRIGSKVVPPSWCGIGGHFEKDELNDPKACILRELTEEIGLTQDDLETINLRYITLRLIHNEVRQNHYFFATLKKDSTETFSCTEGVVAWMNLTEIEHLEMPFTAKYVLNHYVHFGRETSALYSGSAVEDNVLFTELKDFGKC